jgi:hypothetical protein
LEGREKTLDQSSISPIIKVDRKNAVPRFIVTGSGVHRKIYSLSLVVDGFVRDGESGN